MVYLSLIVVAFIFGGTFISGRVLAGDVPAFIVVFLRFLIAAIILLIILYKKGRIIPKLSLVMWLCVVGLAVANLMYNVCFISGLQTVHTARASIIIATNPAVTAIISGVLFKEGLSISKALGIVLALMGAVIAISNGNVSLIIENGVSQGDLFIFGAVLCWVVYALLTKYALRVLNVLDIVTWSCVIGVILQLPFIISTGGILGIMDYNFNSWLALFYLGVFGTVIGFIVYYNAVDIIGVTRTSVFINLVPVCAIFEAWLILDEKVYFALVVGGVMVLLGVFLTNSSMLSKVEGNTD